MSPRQNEANATVREIVIEHASEYDNRRNSSEAITDTTTLDELGMDSLDRTDIAIGLGVDYKLTIPDETVEGWKTVGDVVRTVEQMCEARR